MGLGLIGLMEGAIELKWVADICLVINPFKSPGGFYTVRVLSCHVLAPINFQWLSMLIDNVAILLHSSPCRLLALSLRLTMNIPN
jgi:hypothetical protein